MTIGIDPDKDLSGVAVKQKENGILKVQLYTLAFFPLFDFLKDNKTGIEMVVIEGGWLNKKSNWHNNNQGTGVAAAVGRSVGINHGTGLLIVDMCKYLGIAHRIVKPLRKAWKGKDGKITHEEFVRYFKLPVKRSNQEQRDAALLIL
jgi:hypothetical protein